MPYFGAHMSIAGGLHHAFTHLAAVDGEALQIFTRNQRQWQVSALDKEETALFKEVRQQSKVKTVASHTSYLINLASTNKEIIRKSIEALAAELSRSEKLEIDYVILHPGSHMGNGIGIGLQRLVDNLDKCFTLTNDSSKIEVLIETTAGQGTGIGSTFEQIAQILNASNYSARLGVCLDTCHVYAAGYDFRTAEGYHAMMDEFDATIGLKKLRLFHLNDSRKAVRSHVDRHEHIGKGQIGLQGFAHLITDERFAEHSMIIETPKGKDLTEDKENLKILKELAKI